MPQLDFDGANSKISADKIQGQSGTTVTIPAGHNLAGDGSGLTSLPAANLTGTINDSHLASGTIAYTKSLRTDVPCFMGHRDTQAFDLTGNGTVYTTVWDGERFDQGTNFDGTSTFTAPVTGKYLFCINIDWNGAAGSSSYLNTLVTSNRSYNFRDIYPSGTMSDNNGRSYAVIVDMDASDTAYVNISMNGIGSNTCDLNGNGIAGYSFFSGVLVA